MSFPVKVTFKVVKPTDARGWIGFGCFILTLIVLGMIVVDKSLLQQQAFLVLATAIIVTGWINGPVGWAYQATKGGGEAAESSARIAEQAATAALPPIPPASGPAEVVVVNEPDAPVPTTPGEPA